MCYSISYCIRIIVCIVITIIAIIIYAAQVINLFCSPATDNLICREMGKEAFDRSAIVIIIVIVRVSVTVIIVITIMIDAEHWVGLTKGDILRIAVDVLILKGTILMIKGVLFELK